MKLTRLHRGYAYTSNTRFAICHKNAQQAISIEVKGILMFIMLLLNLDNTFIKRWETPLSNVGKYLCQTLENTFVKRWKIPLSTLEITFFKRAKYLFQALDNILVQSREICLYNVGQYPVNSRIAS